MSRPIQRTLIAELYAKHQLATLRRFARAGWLMTMTGHERAAAWMIGGSGLLQIALAIPLTAAFGIVGTATATLIAVLARSLMLSIFLRRRLGILLVPAAPGTLRA